MSYAVQVDQAALRQLRKLEPQARQRVGAAIELLSENPRRPGQRNLSEAIVIAYGPVITVSSTKSTTTF